MLLPRSAVMWHVRAGEKAAVLDPHGKFAMSVACRYLAMRTIAIARKLLGWPKICKLAHTFLWEHSCKGEKLAQLLGQLGVFLTEAGK